MRARSGALRSLAVAATLVAALQTPACASDWTSQAGRLRHRGQGISLSDPSALSGSWRRVEVEGAELVYQAPEGATMSFLRECRSGREASPRLEARQLLFGLEERRLVEDRALEVADAPGWMQKVEARDEGRRAWLKTVTRLAGPCREDWVLATPAEPGAAEKVFDAWWRSYRPAGAVAGAEGAGADGEVVAEDAP